MNKEEWKENELKGQCQVTCKHFNQFFLCMRGLFSMSFKGISLPYTIIDFLFASLKLPTNFEYAY
jgi:hypothetical protein